MKKLFDFLEFSFGFSKSEAKGFVVLSLIILLILFLPRFIRVFEGNDSMKEEDASKLNELVSVFLDTIEVSRNNFTGKGPENPINPNIAPYNDLLLAGFTERSAKTIISYRNKGGHFESVNDLLKIYTIDREELEKVRHHLIFPKTRSRSEKESVIRSQKTEKIYLDINTCDSTDLRKIKGIGRVLSSRIIKYRNILGGFTSKSQLEEVYGLEVEALRNLRSSIFISDNFKPKQLSLNDAKVNDLQRHPYINNDAARKIVVSRITDGSFGSPEDLVRRGIVAEKELEKLKPYITI